MKRIALLVVASAMLLAPLANAAETSAAAKEADAPKVEMKTFEAKMSYSVGVQIGNSLKSLKEDINLDLVMRGLRDAFGGKKPLLSQKEMMEVQMELSKRMHAAQMKEKQASGKNNLEEGKKFLEANGKKKGVVTTKSGLQYLVVTEGKGPKPKATDRVKVHYRGTLIDGTEFDSSYSRGKPAAFPVRGVIKGWTEALQLMGVGSKYQLFIPPDLAYGEQGPQKIGSNSTLIFEVELLEIE